jgi:alcohol dehydrogenase, propanol-preferring
MKAWSIRQPGPVDRHPMVPVDRAAPVPMGREVRVAVSVCGVCRTDLHLAEGDLPPHLPGAIPGHEIIGVVDQVGERAERFRVGDRIGIAWLRRTCGTCRFCARGDENLCIDPRFTGWDADGGYAEHAVVDERYAYRIPRAFEDHQAAPLLCAGIIGYRALRRAEVPKGGRLGIYGFGGSAHLAAQVAIAQGATVHVMTRSPDARSLALRLGAASAGGAYDPPPEPLDAAILFAPVGDLVPTALSALDRGGTLAIAGIHLTDIPPLRYADHLFQERQVRSVTANTRRDGDEFLAIAARIPIVVEVTRYPFDRADLALSDLANDRFTGVAVLDVAGSAQEHIGGDHDVRRPT